MRVASGTDVTLIADEHERGFEVDAELKAVLLEAMAAIAAKR